MLPENCLPVLCFLNVRGALEREHGSTVPVDVVADIVLEKEETQAAHDKMKETHDDCLTVIGDMKDSLHEFITDHYDLFVKRNERLRYSPPLPLKDLLDDTVGGLIDTFNLVSGIVEDDHKAAVEEAARLTEAMQEMAAKAVQEVAKEELEVLEKENQRLRFWIECREREDKAKADKKAKAKAKKELKAA